MSGTYVLGIETTRETSIDVGALGTVPFEAGGYVYVGSAFGPGGFARIDRHRNLARGERDVRHWHIDYLLGSPNASLEAVVLFPDEDRECELAEALSGTPVPSFGASDCSCDAHLLAVTDLETTLDDAVETGGVFEAELER